MTQTAIATPATITYEQFLEWSDEDTRAEWVDGKAVPMSPVSRRHQQVGLFLLRLFSDFLDANPLGEVYYAEFQMKLPDNRPGREPDLIFVSQANLHRLRENYLDGPADLVVEIVSPESRVRDRGEKYYEYEQGGVTEYWLIDPLRGQAEFYQRGTSGFYAAVTPGPDGRYFSAILPGFWIKPDWLWQDPLPRPAAVQAEWRGI